MKKPFKHGSLPGERYAKVERLIDGLFYLRSDYFNRNRCDKSHSRFKSGGGERGEREKKKRKK